MPLELIVLLGGIMLLGFMFVTLSAVAVIAFRRNSENRYGEPPRWMVTDWRRQSARAVRRREANERLADLVAENDFVPADDEE